MSLNIKGFSLSEVLAWYALSKQTEQFSKIQMFCIFDDLHAGQHLEAFEISLSLTTNLI